MGADNTASDWQVRNLPFRALNTASTAASLWVCGTDESIAMSSDGGEHWVMKHQRSDGAVLLNIGFVNEKFGYAAGTGGSVFLTEDGGETWSTLPAGKDVILQLSFSDPKHGLIRTFSSLLFTVDGGTTWSEVSPGQNVDNIKQYPYTFALVVLDSSRMAIMMKRGSAQYETQGFWFTNDSGKSWKFLNIPNVTLYSFLGVQGKYWTVGTEVIHKDQPGGGYGVPVALYSSDGEKWEHLNNDLSACKLHMCIACTTGGCLSANGDITEFFSDKTSHKQFSPTRDLTTKWAAAGSGMCFVGNGLQCASVKPVATPSASDLPLPTAVSPGPLGAPTAQGPHCILCNLDRIVIDNKVQGAYTIKLTLEILKNGVVRSAVAEDAPTPDVKAHIEKQAQEWIFEPYLKDGLAVNVKLSTSAHLNVIRPR
jgi:photosystem II stability/assembly factor-like uncharacterized protein